VSVPLITNVLVANRVGVLGLTRGTWKPSGVQQTTGSLRGLQQWCGGGDSLTPSRDASFADVVPQKYTQLEPCGHVRTRMLS